jgi:hypothetical protein
VKSREVIEGCGGGGPLLSQLSPSTSFFVPYYVVFCKKILGWALLLKIFVPNLSNSIEKAGV